MRGPAPSPVGLSLLCAVTDTAPQGVQGVRILRSAQEYGERFPELRKSELGGAKVASIYVVVGVTVRSPLSTGSLLLARVSCRQSKEKGLLFVVDAFQCPALVRAYEILDRCPCEMRVSRDVAWTCAGSDNLEPTQRTIRPT